MKFSIHMIWQAALALILILLVTVAFPIWLDPYNVFHYDAIRFNGVEPNQNFIKTRYILDNPTRFDSFLFGSSRVGMIDVSKIKEGRFYNMSYSEGLPQEHLGNLKCFVANGVKISNVWLGLDNISCFSDPERHKKSLMRKPYPADGNLWKFYLPYINCSKAFHALDTILGAKKSDGEKEKDFYATGNSWLSQETNLDEKANRPAWDKRFTPRFDKSIEEIKEIVDLCKENGIKLKVFVNPLYVDTYKKCLEEGYGDFLSELGKVTPYYDFSTIPQTTNRNDYIETSHYRFEVGDYLIKCLEDPEEPFLKKQ